MINKLFYACVDWLKDVAAYFHATYEMVNVVIFCVIEPIVFILMALFIVYQFVKIRKLKKAIA
jgi:hypothetical protein